MSEEVERISRTVYMFGSLNSRHYCNLVLRRDGSVRVHQHANESRWRFEDGVLSFLTEGGVITSQLRYYSDSNVFLANSLADQGHYLLPVISLDAGVANATRAPIIVNSIPKSGTYFLEHVLTNLGFRFVGLHLGAHGLYDNRNVPPHEIHWEPGGRYVACPAHATAEVMSLGEFAVGHIDNKDTLRHLRDGSAHVLMCVRDLRDVLVSLYRFKRARVAPTCPKDEVWRSLSGPDAFIAFLACYADHDIALIRATAEAAMHGELALLRFEDLCAGKLPDDIMEKLDEIEAGFGHRFAEQVARSNGVQTSTLSEQRSKYAELWSPACEKFFCASGLADANAALGYPSALDI